MVHRTDHVNIILADYDNQRLMEFYNRIQNAHPMLRISSIAQTGADTVNLAATMEVDAVLVDFNMIDKTAMDIATELKELEDNALVFAISESLTADLVFQAKNRGIVDLFKRDALSIQDVATTIVEHVQSQRKEWEELAQQHGAIEKGTKNTKIVKEYITKTIPKTTILTYNMKGGVGKSTIATNLAVAIKTAPFYAGKRVALVDFDCGGANVGTLMKVDDHDVINRNLAAWESVDPRTITPDEVESLMIRGLHGVMVLPAPLNMGLAEKIASSEKLSIKIATNATHSLKRFFDVIVIDGAPNISAFIEVALDEADKILLIANPEGQALKQLAKLTSSLKDISNNSGRDYTYLLNKMFVVLNHAQNPTQFDLKPQEVARTIERPLLREIPNDIVIKECLHNNAKKVPVDFNPTSPFSIAIKKLANDLVGAYPEGVGEPGAGAPGARKKKKNLLGIFGR